MNHGFIGGPPQTGIVLDTPPSPERRIADLEERLRQVIAEREQVIAKASAQAADLHLRVSNAMAAVEARDDEIRRLNAIIDERADVRSADLVAEVERLRAALAENSQVRMGHPWLDIAAMPQVWVSGREGGTCHESMMRSFPVAEEVRRLLELGTPVSVVLLVMDLLENRGRS